MTEPSKDIEALKEMTEKKIGLETERETEQESADGELDDKDPSKEASSDKNPLEESLRRHQKILESLQAARQKINNVSVFLLRTNLITELLIISIAWMNKLACLQIFF